MSATLVQPKTFVVGMRMELTFEVRDKDDELTNTGTVTFRYAPPGEAVQSADVTPVSTGTYRASFLITKPGTWRYAIDTTDGIDSAYDRAFHVPARSLP